jgi:hypothetical protein
MRYHLTLVAVGAIGALAAAGCSSSDDTSTATTTLVVASGDQRGPSTAPMSPPTPPSTAVPAASHDAPSVPTSPAPAASVQPGHATIVRFTSGDTLVDVTITDDSATIRDFLSLLPLTLQLEEFNGREKIGNLPRRLDTAGSPGSDPEDGDLIYYAPWGNVGFYYNAAGIGHDDNVIHLGTFSATAEQLAALEGGDVTVDIVGP